MMTSSETLFNPQGETFEETMRAYYSVCKDYARVKASMKQVQNNKNISFLGDKSEIESAYKIISHSFKEASLNISHSDIKGAVKSGLLSEVEFAEILKLQRQQQAAQGRKKQTVTNSNKSNHTR